MLSQTYYVTAARHAVHSMRPYRTVSSEGLGTVYQTKQALKLKVTFLSDGTITLFLVM